MHSKYEKKLALKHEKLIRAGMFGFWVSFCVSCCLDSMFIWQRLVTVCDTLRVRIHISLLDQRRDWELASKWSTADLFKLIGILHSFLVPFGRYESIAQMHITLRTFKYTDKHGWNTYCWITYRYVRAYLSNYQVRKYLTAGVIVRRNNSSKPMRKMLDFSHS